MSWFGNRGINRLALHTGLHQFAWCMSGVFFGVYLLRAGVSPAGVFLTGGMILLLRFVTRPLILFAVPRLGLRRSLAIGTALTALQYPAIGLVHGPGIALAGFTVIGALAGIFYWPCYHALFAAIGDDEHRGSQIGIRQIVMGLAAVLGPLTGGVMLTNFGPWTAFCVAAAIELAAILPLLQIPPSPVSLKAPDRAYAAAKPSMLMFATDGWIICSAAVAWDIVMFRALQSRFDAFGGTLALAALAGAVAALGLGRIIDLGHAQRAVRINGAALAIAVLLRAFCGENAHIVVLVAVVTTMLGGLYIPTLMTAFYNASKDSPCPLRFQFATEGAWDLGGAAASLIAAGFCALDLPLGAAMLLALPAVLLQMRLLARSYRRKPAPSPTAPQPAMSSPF